MSIATEVVQTFGESIGLQALDLPENGSVQLAFERRGLLCMEETAQGLVLCLFQQVDLRDGALAVYSRALASCHYRQGLPWQVRPGLRGDSMLVFALELASIELNLPNIERAINLLTELQDHAVA